MIKKLFFLLSMSLPSILVGKAPSYEHTKYLLKSIVYRSQAETFYCGCPFDAKTMTILTVKSCPQKPHDDYTGSGFKPTDVNWEHIVPVSRFHPRNYNKATKELLKKIAILYSNNTTLYSLMKSDPHNLVPSHAQTNYNRGNKKLSILKKPESSVQNCSLRISDKERIAEPMKNIRGKIARAYLYMENAYPDVIQLSKKEKERYLSWHELFPPSRQEKSHIHQIQQIWKFIPSHASYFHPLLRTDITP